MPSSGIVSRIILTNMLLPSLLWPLLNDKFPGINDIGRGRQDARGRRKREGEGRHGQRGEKMEEEREGRGTKGGEREKRHSLHP